MFFTNILKGVNALYCIFKNFSVYYDVKISTFLVGERLLLPVKLAHS